jgi:hypothetical protein
VLQAECHFLGNGDGDNSVVEGEPLNASCSRFDLAFRQIVDRVHHRCGLEKQQGWQGIPKHLQMRVDNIRVMLPQNAMQPVIRPPIKSPSLSQVLGRNVALIQTAFQLAANAAPNRDDRHLKPLTVQPPDNVYRNALGTTRA